MEGPEKPDVPPIPTPYRDGKALSEIIPPDRRREKTIAIVVLSMIAGVGLWQIGGWLIERLSQREEPTALSTTPGYIANRIPASVLHGPRPGSEVRMPPSGRSVVHVWLQGCADCMPAFEAMRDLEQNGGLGLHVPIVNVAYGEADEVWARRYGVSENLVFDPGGANVVRPLGIGTFTTLVVNGDGVIIHRDRPDRPGYRERVRAAVSGTPGTFEPEVDPADPLAPPPKGVVPPSPPGDPTKGTFDSETVGRVVAAHRAEIKRACWDRLSGEKLGETSVQAQLAIGTDGRVVHASATGTDPAITKCIEGQVKMWVFPPPSSTTTVNIPFKFVRQ